MSIQPIQAKIVPPIKTQIDGKVVWCFERGAIDRINDIVASERDLRIKLIDIRREQPDKVVAPVIEIVHTGWPVIWTCVIGGIVVGLAVSAGYMVGSTN